MEDRMEIKVRFYKEFFNDVTKTLQMFLKEPNTVSMINTGVTVDEDTMYSIVCAPYTVGTFRVNKDGIVVTSTINPLCFDQPFYNMTSIFYAKDKKIISDYIRSFTGMKLIEEGDSNV